MIPILTRKNALSGNPGDVFIGWGLQWLITQATKNPRFLLLDKFDNKDFEEYKKEIKHAKYIIYAGTPQYNRYSDWCLWYDWDMYSQYVIPWGLKFYPLAGGSGFPSVRMTSNQFADYCLADKKTKDILQRRQLLSGITTTRDPHAHMLLNKMNWENKLLPCTAIWSHHWTQGTISNNNTIAFIPPNQEMIEPSILGMTQSIEVVSFIKKLYLELRHRLQEKGYRVIALCHGYKEYKALCDLPDVQYTNDIWSLMRTYQSLHGVISTRLHGAMPCAGMGKPSVLLGIDTRSHAAITAGIPLVMINSPDLVNDLINSYGCVNNYEWHADTYIGLLKSILNEHK